MTYSEELNISKNPVLRWLLLAAGTIFVAIGILGMFLPLLPTTVFFLLAAYCYARSSEKFYHWLHHNRFFGKYLRNYRQGKGMTIGSKVTTLLILWLAISYSAFFALSQLYVRILLFMIAIGVTWHILTVKTASDSE
jgi:uncharacterized membrane protein YbaN (DUF454 family)